jgi:hypothetical protein
MIAIEVERTSDSLNYSSQALLALLAGHTSRLILLSSLACSKPLAQSPLARYRPPQEAHKLLSFDTQSSRAPAPSPTFASSACSLTKFKNHSALAVPYLTALVPLHPVPHIPPIVAPGPGSNGKKSGTPFSLRYALRSSHLTPGWRVTSASGTERRRILSIRDMSRDIPPYGWVLAHRFGKGVIRNLVNMGTRVE